MSIKTSNYAFTFKAAKLTKEVLEKAHHKPFLSNTILLTIHLQYLSIKFIIKG